jgi:hypothetical protein
MPRGLGPESEEMPDLRIREARLPGLFKLLAVRPFGFVLLNFLQIHLFHLLPLSSVF